MLVFVLQWLPSSGNSNQVIASVSIDHLWNSKRDISFHHTPYDYSSADWDDETKDLT